MKALQIKITRWQRHRLQVFQKHPPAPRAGKRATCLLLSADGALVSLIRQATGLSRKAITDIRQRFRRHSLRALVDRPRSGRPPRITPAYRRELRRALARGPLAFGYVWTCWSIARLGTHLHRRTGIAVSREYLRQLVHAQGYRIGRPRHTLALRRRRRQSARGYRRAQKQLQQLKKGQFCLRPATNSGTATRANSPSIPTWPDAG
jgi:transposase